MKELKKKNLKMLIYLKATKTNLHKK